MEDNTEVEELPEGLFKHISFQRIVINNTALKKVQPSAILPLKHLHVELGIQHSLLENFPFYILNQLQRLESLWLYNNSLTSIPAFKSDSLEILRLDNNKITRVEFDGWATPNLKKLYLFNNLLTSFPAFNSNSIELIWLYNNLLTSVPAFKSETLEILRLDQNKITSVEFDGWATPKLVRLDLDDNLLTYVPAFKSESLEILYLNDNEIESVDFDGWATPKLIRLDLYKNLLTYVPAFKSESLEILYLNDNEIESVEFDRWTTPKLRELYLYNNLLTFVPAFKSESLEILRLDNNKITSVQFDGWATPNLKKLYLYNNLLTFVPAFKSESLEILRLDNNNITSVDFDGWATPKLMQVDLDNNLLTYVPAFKSESLEILYLNGNEIESVEFDGWATPKLRELHLYDNFLNSFPAFKSENLEILRLDNNKITNVEVDGWATPSLRELNIAKNPLLKFPSAAIKGMKNLEKFYYSESNVGPTVSSGFLEFQSKALKLVTLWSNNISILDKDAITGLGPNTTVQLTNNDIVILSEEIFRPMLEILSAGDGVLFLDEKIVLYGRSLGSVPTVRLASERENLPGVILHSPLSSALGMVLRFTPWSVGPFAVTDLVPRITCPVPVVHGTQDEIIPNSHGRVIHDKCQQKVDALWVEGAGHNNMEAYPQFWRRFQPLLGAGTQGGNVAVSLRRERFYFVEVDELGLASSRHKLLDIPTINVDQF
ncbi:unnamed protein product [Darwinula stevensoni]|uniref:Uncharacterized protein n=1 Tax=Darwinula stevensoni TaxID=69355 RepID=A0A7R8XAG9_9CRUS|nr:unnamed protein product [Darwinula stevensoni]CAG0885486.1 unnamed protein product [Darwinula stevensoni]